MVEKNKKMDFYLVRMKKSCTFASKFNGCKIYGHKIVEI